MYENDIFLRWNSRKIIWRLQYSNSSRLKFKTFLTYFWIYLIHFIITEKISYILHNIFWYNVYNNIIFQTIANYQPINRYENTKNRTDYFSSFNAYENMFLFNTSIRKLTTSVTEYGTQLYISHTFIVKYKLQCLT